jgi:hypothetical protein
MDRFQVGNRLGIKNVISSASIAGILFPWSETQERYFLGLWSKKQECYFLGPLIRNVISSDSVTGTLFSRPL